MIYDRIEPRMDDYMKIMEEKINNKMTVIC